MEVGRSGGDWGSVRVYLSHTLLRGMQVQKRRLSASSEGTVFGPLMPECCSLHTCTGPVLGSAVPTILSWLEPDRGRSNSSSWKTT